MRVGAPGKKKLGLAEGEGAERVLIGEPKWPKYDDLIGSGY
jgi:hypothetical protein